MGIKDVALGLVAIMALFAALGLVRNWRRAGPKLRIAVETMLPEGTDSAEGAYVRVSATNIGRRPITVTSLSLEFPGTKSLADCAPASQGQLDTPMPAKLAIGEVAQASFDIKDISDRLLRLGARTECRIYGRCMDSGGQIHRSEPWPIMP
jgi:hypothetical protein